MRCEYIFGYEDYLESVKAYRKRAKGAAFVYYLDVWILPAVGLLIATFCLAAYLRHDDYWFEATIWLATFGIAGALLLPLFYRLKLRQTFKQWTSLSKDNPMFVEFDGESIRFTVPGGADVVYPWTSFTDYFENDAVAVLFIQKAAFHTTPKRAMGEDDWIQFRQIVERYVRKS
jgi:hypothetical protein